MDMTRLEAGSDWRLDIGNGLLSSRLVLYVGSRASVVSDWCIKELHMAKKHNLTVSCKEKKRKEKKKKERKKEKKNEVTK
jgi:hypothetical protein